MLTPLPSFWASAERLLPPIIRPYVCTWWVINSFSTPYVCMANSRVGDKITTPVPEKERRHFHWLFFTGSEIMPMGILKLHYPYHTKVLLIPKFWFIWLAWSMCKLGWSFGKGASRSGSIGLMHSVMFAKCTQVWNLNYQYFLVYRKNIWVNNRPCYQLSDKHAKGGL